MQDIGFNEILNNKLHLGSEKLLSYKKEIMDLIYNKSIDLSSLESAIEIIESYKDAGGSTFDVIELYVFFLECATHVLADFGVDIEQDLHDVLDGVFGTVLRRIKRGENELFVSYTIRLREVIELLHDISSELGQKLSKLWHEAFGHLED